MNCFCCAKKSDWLCVLDAQPGGPEEGPGEWKVIVICPQCLTNLDPDMWTCEEHWMALNPAVPYSKLPPCGEDDYQTSHWVPETYAAFAPPPNEEKGKEANG